MLVKFSISFSTRFCKSYKNSKDKCNVHTKLVFRYQCSNVFYFSHFSRIETDVTFDVLFDRWKFNVNVYRRVSVDKRSQSFVEIVENVHGRVQLREHQQLNSCFTYSLDRR